jgi:hypothetical protein
MFPRIVEHHAHQSSRWQIASPWLRGNVDSPAEPDTTEFACQGRGICWVKRSYGENLLVQSQQPASSKQQAVRSCNTDV